MIKRCFLVVLTMLTIVARGETFKAGEVYSITLPEEWRELSKPFLADFAERVRKNMEWNEPQPYDYAYQIGEEYGSEFQFPCILVEVVSGRLLPATLNQLAEEADESQEAVYDKTNRIFWTTEIDEDAGIVRRIALKQTQKGFIRFTGCVPENEYAEFRPTFEKAVTAVKVNEDIRYRAGWFDDLPPVFGLNTGRLILWGVQSILVGGILWGIYILIKCTIRRMRAKSAVQ